MPQKKALHTIDVSGHTVIVKKSTRRKTIAIKVNNQGIFLHIPDILPLEIASAFVEKKLDWIEQKLKFTQTAEQSQLKYQEGDTLLLLGEQYAIVVKHLEKASDPEIFIQDQQIEISPQLAQLDDVKRQTRFKQWYQLQAEDYLIKRSQHLSRHCDIEANSFQVKTYKARWGSCSQGGHIRYNWKIIQASKATIDYLIIHELCHLIEHNHSPAFWSLVAQFCPGYKQHRQWLRTYGHLINI